MRKLVEVKEGFVTDQQIQFSIDAIEPSESLEAAGRMLTDSDACAFVYLLDTGTEYIYVHFKEHTWPMLAEALQRTDVPLLQWGSQIMPLASFHEELWMLIENIEGNDNYGETFYKAVEETFQEALASRS